MESDITDIIKIKIRLKRAYIISLTGGIYYENEQEGINFSRCGVYPKSWN